MKKVGRTKLIIGVTLLLLMLTSGIVQAVHNLDLFELDRDAVAGSDPGDDWNTLYGGGGSAIKFTGILQDIVKPGYAGTQFQGGGSKDNSDITDWLWKTGEPLDKDDITDAYAAAYINNHDDGTNHVGDLIFYYGLDRFSANGSAQIGFWFLQDPTFGLTNTASGGGFKFSGVHMDGDILVQSNFSQGGVINRITVYSWQAGALVEEFSAADCLDGSTANDKACATVNQSPTTSPWPYVPKANEGASGTFLTGAFFEGGINITSLVPEAGCFTGFVAETRTSTPFDARLKDFVTGNLDICSLKVTKTGDTLSKVGDDVNYTVTIENTGGIKIYKDDISDTLLGDIAIGGVDQSNSYVVTNTCGAYILPGATCTITLKRTVQVGDPDPLPNTVSVTYRGKSDLSGQAVSGSDDHSVNLFQPGVSVEKTGDTLSKVGDDVNYTITITNTGSSDSPDLVNGTISDTLLGDLLDGSNTFVTSSDCTTTLATGSSCTIDATRTVLAGDPDPLPNTVTVHYNPDGFTNDITDSDDHTVNLFQPAIAVDKTGDALSKIGDSVNYTFTLSNNSSVDTPVLTCTATDTHFGIIFEGTLPSGDTVINKSRTVLGTDPDPLENTVSMLCFIEGFPNTLTKDDKLSVNLFQPGVDVVKTGDAFGKIGDVAHYTITVTNTSSSDSPNLVNGTIVDDVLGNLLDPANPYVKTNTCTTTLTNGGSCTITAERVVLGTDPDPLKNTVTVHYNPQGFPNDISDSDDHTVNLFQPAIAAAKTGDTLSKIGDPVNYTFTLSNNSSVDTPALTCTATDSLLGSVFSGTLPLGDTVINKSRTVQVGDPDPLGNTVTLTCSIAGFPNVLSATASHSVNLFQPGVDVVKTGDALGKIGDPVDYLITVTNTSSSDSPNLVNGTIVDTILGNLLDPANPYVTAKTCTATLATGGSCTINATRTVLAGDPDQLKNIVTVHYNPDGFPNDITDSDDHTVNLFQPAIAAAKTGDTLSKIGDSVNYTFTLSNNSSADTPALTCTATDSLLGSVFSGTLPLGDTVINKSRTVQVGDPDPLGNTVTLTCSIAGFPNVLTATASHSVNLFQPSVQVIKTGPATAVRGQTITYSFTINNTSSSDSPNLILDSVTDTILGSLTATAAANGCSTLASGGSCSFTFNYTIQSGDPSPLVNVVTVHYHPSGFPNDITDNDDHSLELLTILGCTPGFWQGGAGAQLWDQVDDPDWAAGGYATQFNPFTHGELFNDFFPTVIDTRLNGMSMFDLVSSGGTSDWAVKAARDMVAAYLNESAFPLDFPATSLVDLVTMWYNAVDGGDAALAAFHTTVSAWNSPLSPGYCPLP